MRIGFTGETVECHQVRAGVARGAGWAHNPTNRSIRLAASVGMQPGLGGLAGIGLGNTDEHGRTRTVGVLAWV